MSASQLHLTPTTTPEPLAQPLRDLRLAFFAETHEDLAKEAADKQTSHLEYLAELVQGETQLRRDRATHNRIRQARFPSH